MAGRNHSSTGNGDLNHSLQMILEEIRVIRWLLEEHEESSLLSHSEIEAYENQMRDLSEREWNGKGGYNDES